MRNSIQRQLILDAIKTLHHSTAAEIHEYIRSRYPSISLGTVYRNLNSMVEEGIIHRLSLPDGPDRFEIRLRRHYHVVCSECGAIVDLENIPEETLQELDGTVETSTGFSVWAHDINFSGSCPRCKSGRENQ